jgi:hypothetical protein
MDEVHRINNRSQEPLPSPRISEPPMLNVRRAVRSLWERDRRLKRPRLVKGPGDTDCFHCGQMFFMHQSRGGRFGLCQSCLDS